MPVTFPAHQGLIVGAKLRWPRQVDGTALCVGAAAPDLFYALGPWANRQSHTLTGLLVLAVPVTLISVILIRWRAARGIFRHVPDIGPLRLKSYAVLSQQGKHPWYSTLVSSLIGAGSHILIDGFTHSGRFGARWLGADQVVTTAPFFDDITFAGLLQYLGHTMGSLVFVAVLLAIASRGALEEWYGVAEVGEARAQESIHLALFGVLAIGPPVVAFLAGFALGRSPVFMAITVGFLSLQVSGAVVAGESP